MPFSLDLLKLFMFSKERVLFNSDSLRAFFFYLVVLKKLSGSITIQLRPNVFIIHLDLRWTGQITFHERRKKKHSSVARKCCFGNYLAFKPEQSHLNCVFLRNVLTTLNMHIIRSCLSFTPVYVNNSRFRNFIPIY